MSYKINLKKSNKNFLPEQNGGSPIHSSPVPQSRERFPEVRLYPLAHA